MSWTPPSARPHLPTVSLAPFGGRDEPSRLPIPLTGVGGVGKTRLALRVASHLAAEVHFADGVVFVDLATVRDPDLVTAVIAQTLNGRGVGQEPAVPALKTFLGNRHLLLILDNCPHGRRSPASNA